jgi:hypothetical protein
MTAANFSGDTCHSCGHPFVIGETAYASDWRVVTADGARMETRYTCEGCEARA